MNGRYCDLGLWKKAPNVRADLPHLDRFRRAEFTSGDTVGADEQCGMGHVWHAFSRVRGELLF
jgi:hypothetical protein